MSDRSAPSLDRNTLLKADSAGTVSPVEVIDEVYRRIAAQGDDKVWLHLIAHEQARERATLVERQYSGRQKPALYGLPYGLKDNIHVAGLPTSAACTALHEIAQTTATVVTQLDRVGAILIGKQNLDQFATGLVGIRNPSGYCRNAFNADYIPGGSSSGSAVALAKGLVSNHGFLCDNPSFDIAPVLALTLSDADAVLGVIAGYDPRDPFFQPAASAAAARCAAARGLSLCRSSRTAARILRRRTGGTPVRTRAGDAQGTGRNARRDRFFAFCRGQRYPLQQCVHRRTRDYLRPDRPAAPRSDSPGGARRTGCRRKIQRAGCLPGPLPARRAAPHRAHAVLAEVDVLALPTVGTLYRCAQVEADPIRLNANLGYYTDFVNPLHVSALSVPAGIRPDGLPFGLSLIAGPWREKTLYLLGQRFHRATGGQLGATGTVLERVHGARPATQNLRPSILPSRAPISRC